jgi:predicted nucleic acid-binding protein
MVKIKPVHTIVCDAGPIIHLDELNCLDLLSDFRDIIIPFEVEKEINKHRSSALKSADLAWKRTTGEIDINNRLMTFCKVFSLDLGETQALAIMAKNPQALFLTDDAAARLVAEQMRFNVHGTIGIVVRSLRRRQRKPEEVIQILSNIPAKSTLYIRHTLLKDIVGEVESEYNL